jgi:hypothetical protein
MTKNYKKLQLEKITIFWIKNCVHAAREAFSPQKKTSSTSKQEISSFLSIFVGHFCPLRSGSSRQKSTRIHADLDLQHWLLQTLSMRVYTTVFRESSETKNLSFKKQYKFGAVLALHLYINSQGY